MRRTTLVSIAVLALAIGLVLQPISATVVVGPNNLWYNVLVDWLPMIVTERYAVTKEYRYGSTYVAHAYAYEHLGGSGIKSVARWVSIFAVGYGCKPVIVVDSGYGEISRREILKHSPTARALRAGPLNIEWGYSVRLTPMGLVNLDLEGGRKVATVKDIYIYAYDIQPGKKCSVYVWMSFSVKRSDDARDLMWRVPASHIFVPEIALWVDRAQGRIVDARVTAMMSARFAAQYRDYLAKRAEYAVSEFSTEATKFIEKVDKHMLPSLTAMLGGTLGLLATYGAATFGITVAPSLFFLSEGGKVLKMVEARPLMQAATRYIYSKLSAFLTEYGSLSWVLQATTEADHPKEYPALDIELPLDGTWLLLKPGMFGEIVAYTASYVSLTLRLRIEAAWNPYSTAPGVAMIRLRMAAYAADPRFVGILDRVVVVDPDDNLLAEAAVVGPYGVIDYEASGAKRSFVANITTPLGDSFLLATYERITKLYTSGPGGGGGKPQKPLLMYLDGKVVANLPFGARARPLPIGTTFAEALGRYYVKGSKVPSIVFGPYVLNNKLYFYAVYQLVPVGYDMMVLAVTEIISTKKLSAYLFGRVAGDYWLVIEEPSEEDVIEW